MSETMTIETIGIETNEESGFIGTAVHEESKNDRTEKSSRDNAINCAGRIACANCFFASQCPRSEVDNTSTDTVQEYTRDKLLNDDENIDDTVPLIVPSVLSSVENSDEILVDSIEDPSQKPSIETTPSSMTSLFDIAPHEQQVSREPEVIQELDSEVSPLELPQLQMSSSVESELAGISISEPTAHVVMVPQVHRGDTSILRRAITTVDEESIVYVDAHVSTPIESVLGEAMRQESRADVTTSRSAIETVAPIQIEPIDVMYDDISASTVKEHSLIAKEEISIDTQFNAKVHETTLQCSDTVMSDDVSISHPRLDQPVMSDAHSIAPPQNTSDISDVVVKTTSFHEEVIPLDVVVSIPYALDIAHKTTSTESEIPTIMEQSIAIDVPQRYCDDVLDALVQPLIVAEQSYTVETVGQISEPLVIPTDANAVEGDVDIREAISYMSEGTVLDTFEREVAIVERSEEVAVAYDDKQTNDTAMLDALFDTQEPEPVNKGCGTSSWLSELIGKVACMVTQQSLLDPREYDLIA